MGESQFAEDCFKWEEWEEADEEEAREEGQGGAEHCCFQQSALLSLGQKTVGVNMERDK